MEKKNGAVSQTALEVSLGEDLLSLALVIRSRYGIHPNRWDGNTVRNGSNRNPKKAISKEYPTSLSFVALEVGNEKAIRLLGG